MNAGIPGWFVPATILPSLLIAWCAGYLVRRWAPAWGLVDRPGARKVHTTPTPLGGGLAIWLAVVVPLAVGQLGLWLITTERISADLLPEFVRLHVPGLWQQSVRLWVLLMAGTVLLIVGLLDDRWGLPWQLRLSVQFAVAAACVVWQGWSITAFISIPWVTVALSVIWIVGLVNSFNMLDNMDGLSGGLAAIVASLLAVVVLTNPVGSGPQLFVGGLLLVFVGGLLGFLWHNRPVARLFMGDAGSYFVGFSLAVLTLLATYANYDRQSQHAILTPLCVMAVPLYDLISVVWIRIREGRSPMQADKSHFSHRLVDLGLSKGQAVLTVYLATGTCGLAALLLPRVDWVGAGIIVLMVVCVLALVAILETTARKRG